MAGTKVGVGPTTTNNGGPIPDLIGINSRDLNSVAANFLFEPQVEVIQVHTRSLRGSAL